MAHQDTPRPESSSPFGLSLRQPELTMRSGPSMPSRKPGKCFTAAVVVREPPTKTELPKSRGFSGARAV